AVLFSRSPRHPTPTLFPYTTLFRSTTDDMTRFLLSLDDAVDTIFAGVRTGKRGDLYIPRVPSAKVVDIAAVLIGNRPIETKVIGIRPGEKIHEVLISEEEAHRTVERGNY